LSLGVSNPVAMMTREESSWMMNPFTGNPR